MLSKFDRFVFWLHPRGFERIEIRGVPVYIPFRRGEQFRKTERQISMALDCIALFQPSRMSRIIRNLRGIVVWLQSTQAHFHYRGYQRLCVLDTDFTLQAEHPTMLAIPIIWVATRALLHDCPNQPEKTYMRVVHACTKAELVFAKRVPELHELSKKWERELNPLTRSSSSPSP